MQKAKVTFKGQVTIPREVRKALAIEEGDSVIFTVEGDHAVLRPIKKRPLMELYGALPATRPYPGLEAIRKEIQRKIAGRLNKKKRR